uniref:Uncharacterized protein n=1 Tax=Parascaris equorum TaxID=6256 RepID=A0A914SD63_PAREQ
MMCIAGRFEMMAERERLNADSIEVDSEKRLNMSNCCAQTSREFHDRVKHRCAAFLDAYVKLITNGMFAFGVFCFWIVFIAFSVIVSGLILYHSSDTLLKIYPILVDMYC